MQLATSRTSLTAEPNVLPLIDVLLVMIVTFLMLQKVRQVTEVQLPPPTPTSSPVADQQIVLELRTDGRLEVNGQPTTDSLLGQVLATIYQNRPRKLLFIKAAGGRSYEEVIHLIDIAKGAGVQVFATVPRPKPR